MATDLLQVNIDFRSNADQAITGVDRLTKTIVQTTSTVQILEKQYALLDKAFNSNNMSAQQYAKAVQTVDKNIKRLYSNLNSALNGLDETSKTMDRATVATQKASRAMNQYGNVASRTTRQTKRFASVGLQQVGYQVGDFAVQVQGGTNALVALGQQGSQLLGILGPFGAIAGAALAIYTSIARVNQETSNTGLLFDKVARDMKKALEPIKPIVTAIADAFSYVGNVLIDFVNFILNNMERVIWYFGTGLATAVGVAVVKAFISATTAATTFFAAVRKGLMRIGLGLLIVAIGEVGYRFAKAVEVAGGFAKVLDNVKEAAGLFYDYLGAKSEEFLARIKMIGPSLEAFMLGILNIIEIKIRAGLNLLIKEINSIFAKVNIDPIDLLKPTPSEDRTNALIAAQNRVNDFQKAVNEAVEKANGSWDKFNTALESVFKTVEDTTTKSEVDVRDWFGEVGDDAEESGKKVRNAYLKAMMTAKEFADALDQQVISAIDGVSNAFSDFLQRGMKDFKDFVGSIKDMFVRLLADMAAMALKRQILIPITTGAAAGFGSAAAAQAMASGEGAFAAGTLGGTLAAGASSLSTGFMAGMTGLYHGGISGYAATLSSTAANAGIMSTIGAAIPAVVAVAAVVGLFTKKVKELDSGLRVTVDGTDTLVETFSLLEKSRLFGLIKSKSTEFQAAGADIADPVTEAVSNIQSEILKAADAFGIGAGLFENFTYKFQVSLKGLTEDEKMQAINQELAKMGDEFASLSGHFSDMNSLLAAANERYNLQIRLLETIGKQEEALSMRRESEISSVHELNRELLQAIYAVEDAQRAVDIAFSNLASVIEREKRTLEQGYADSVDALKAGFDNLIDGIEARLEAAQRAASVSQGVYSALESALRGRGFVSESQFSMARETATSYLRELRGAGRIEDEQALEDALKIVAEPSQDLYEDFVSYQRDFQKQTNVIRDLEAKTKLQLSTDEKTLLAIQEEKDAAQIRHEESLSKLDDNLQSELLALDKQYNELVGIKEVNLTMVEAIKAVENAINNLELKQAAAAKIGGVGGGGGVKADFGGNIDLLDKYDAGKDFTRDGKTYDFIKLSGANQLLDAAQQLGIQTAGQTGAQIQQAISNAGNLAVNLDNATRNQQFALGGYFSGGVRMVGERGPELEMTGPSRIMSNNDTRKMLQNPDLVEAVKGMRQEIAELRNEQRQLGINNNKYTKRTYDLYRQWDTEGLPAERT